MSEEKGSLVYVEAHSRDGYDVATLYNVVFKDKVSDFGARVEYNYRHKWWLTPKQPNLISKKR